MSEAKINGQRRISRQRLSDLSRMQESTEHQESAWKGAKDEMQRSGTRGKTKDTELLCVKNPMPKKFEITREFTDLHKDKLLSI